MTTTHGSLNCVERIIDEYLSASSQSVHDPHGATPGTTCLNATRTCFPYLLSNHSGRLNYRTERVLLSRRLVPTLMPYIAH